MHHVIVFVVVLNFNKTIATTLTIETVLSLLLPHAAQVEDDAEEEENGQNGGENDRVEQPLGRSCKETLISTNTANTLLAGTVSYKLQ